MTSTSQKFRIPLCSTPKNILVSVFSKAGLSTFISTLVSHIPDITFFSTGGTGNEIKKVLGENKHTHFHAIEKFTGTPELEGGLVKTLHPKIFSGILGNSANSAHVEYMTRTMKEMTGSSGVFFDVVVCNFYPFEEVISDATTSPEQARVNIDIGGPSMIMAAAKNWHRVAVLTSPDQYDTFILHLKENSGIDPRFRFELAQVAMRRVAEYRMMIAEYYSRLDFDVDILTHHQLEKK